MGRAGQVRKKNMYSEKTPPLLITVYTHFSQRKDYFKNGIYSKGVLIIMASEHMRMMRRQRRCKPPPPPGLSFGDYAPPFHRPQ